MSQALDTKVAELVAVGASLAANCQSCLRYHYDAARKAGATNAEISAAMDIGRMVKVKPDEHIQKLANRLIGGKAAEEPEIIQKGQSGDQKRNVSGRGCPSPNG